MSRNSWELNKIIVKHSNGSEKQQNKVMPILNMPLATYYYQGIGGNQDYKEAETLVYKSIPKWMHKTKFCP